MRWTREDTTEIDLLSKLEGNGMKDKKIRELAIKIKNLNIAYEKEKTMYLFGDTGGGPSRINLTPLSKQIRRPERRMTRDSRLKKPAIAENNAKNAPTVVSWTKRLWK